MTMWRPTRIKGQNGNATTTSACAVPVETDVGSAFAKTLGGPDEPPRALACDWIGSRLGQLMDLPVPAVAICQLDLPLVLNDKGHQAKQGPAFLSKRVENAEVWDGNEAQLRGLQNPEALAGIMVLDTWILNVDRYSVKEGGAIRRNVRNVLIELRGGTGRRQKRWVWAIDHTHCLTRRDGGAFAVPPDAIDHFKNDNAFGVFPAFKPLITEASTRPWIDKLGSIEDVSIRGILDVVPPQWEVTANELDALHRLITRRRDYLLDHWQSIFAPACGWQARLMDPSPEEQ